MKRCKRFNLYYTRTVVEWQGHSVVFYFVRKGKKGKHKYIIKTYKSISFTKTIEIYQIRWSSIEVFFKECKQMLNLGKCQSRDFDAQIASTTITMIQYIFLSLQNDIYRYQSLGKMFEHSKSEVLDERLHHRLVVFLIEILDAIATLFEEADFEDILKKVIYDKKSQQLILSLFNTYKMSDEIAA